MNTFFLNKDFTNHKITTTCTFKAPLNVIWDAFSNPATLEKWFAPEPYKAVTQKADFREGGHWLYYMLSPEGTKHWGITQYKEITPLKSYRASDAFCDELGTIDPHLPQLEWLYEFSEENNLSRVRVTIFLPNEEQMKQLLNMGFKEGYRISLNQLMILLNP